MIEDKQRAFAIEILKNILHILHEKNFADIFSATDECAVENPEDFLTEFVQGTLELNGFDTIDEYGAECSFKPQYAYSQLSMDEYSDNSGFYIEYEMTSGGELVDMVLQLDFLYNKDLTLKSVLKDISPL